MSAVHSCTGQKQTLAEGGKTSTAAALKAAAAAHFTVFHQPGLDLVHLICAADMCPTGHDEEVTKSL